MKSFKTARKAHEHANGLPIIRIGVGRNALFVTGFADLIEAQLTEVTLISPGGGNITGHITLGHLERLGNGNWAIRNDSRPGLARPCFPEGPAFQQRPKAVGAN